MSNLYIPPWFGTISEFVVLRLLENVFMRQKKLKGRHPPSPLQAKLFLRFLSFSPHGGKLIIPPRQPFFENVFSSTKESGGDYEAS